jgi:hypothetical protein
MSTRSVVAFQEGDGWRGRYVHSDGYPSARVPDLLKIVERDGVDAAIKTITETWAGWSSLHATQPEIAGVAPDPDAGWGTPGFTAYLLAPGGMYGDGRFANVPGYGIAYTTESGQIDADHWIDHTDTDIWLEWAYVLNDRGLTVWKRNWDDATRPERPWDLIGFVPWGTDPEGYGQFVHETD